MIEVQSLKKSFGDHQVLKGIDVKINAGEIFFVLGTSGTGKSVLLKVLVGLLRASSGVVKIDGEELDLAKTSCEDFIRILDMKTGLLERSYTAILSNGNRVKLSFKRFCSMSDDETAAIQLTLQSDKNCKVELNSFLDADVRNEDSNYDEAFWENLNVSVSGAIFRHDPGQRKTIRDVQTMASAGH